MDAGLGPAPVDVLPGSDQSGPNADPAHLREVRNAELPERGASVEEPVLPRLPSEAGDSKPGERVADAPPAPATPTPTPRPASALSAGQYDVAAFGRGYLDAGGPPDLLAHFTGRVIPCESSGLIDPGNPDYLGIAQFTRGTFAANARAGADWRDSYEQGWAVGTLIRRLLASGVSPGSTAGWPTCWHVGGGP